MISKIILNEIKDYRGNLSFAEEQSHIPFEVKSAFWTSIEDVKSIASQDEKLFIISLKGQLDINSSTHVLTQPNQALIVDEYSQLKIQPVTEECILLVLSSQPVVSNISTFSVERDMIGMPYTHNHLGLSGFYANSLENLPFDIKRVYFIYDIPKRSVRGGHAHIGNKGLIFSLAGSFDVTLDRRINPRKLKLDNPQQGMFLDTATWRVLDNFRNDSLVMVLTSERYDADDYIRDYNVFKKKYLTNKKLCPPQQNFCASHKTAL